MKTPYGEVSLQIEAVVISESGDVIQPFDPIDFQHSNHIDGWLNRAQSDVEFDIEAYSYSILLFWHFIAEDGTKGMTHVMTLEEMREVF